MRQGQNNAKRSRGRGGRNNGGRPQHSANRSYDSNGPDVKIRGTATHVCEKYQQLARDAISAGDRVMAENYFQHAEHYYRLLMAAQTGQEGQVRPQNSLGYRPPEDEEEETDFTADNQPQPRHPGQPWHQQGGNGQQGGGQVNGGHRTDDEDEGDDERQPDQRAGQPDRQGDNREGPEGEGQPRRRQGRRRRPRGEGPQGEQRRVEGSGGGEGNEGGAPRAEAPVVTAPDVGPGD